MKTRKRPSRYGLSMAEVLVSGVVLVTGMGIVSQGAVKSYRLQTNSRHYQLAQDEVANQMERWTMKLSKIMPIGREDALKVIVPSDLIQQVFPEAKLYGELVSDEEHSGQWLRLTFWQDQTVKAVPISLVGWIQSNYNSQNNPVAFTRSFEEALR